MLEFSHRFTLTVGFGFVAAWNPSRKVHDMTMPPGDLARGAVDREEPGILLRVSG